MNSKTQLDKDVPGGIVHTLPLDFKSKISHQKIALVTWLDITTLARNEWICWIDSAKKTTTREKRINWACQDLAQGKRRPCCWSGCPHR